MGPRASIDACPSARRGLLQVVLDGPGVARLGVVRVAPGLAQRAALAQQVPAAVELDLDSVEALAVALQNRLVGAVALLGVAQLALLGHEPLDAGGDALV